jgi:hypothetical protein
LGRLPFPLSEAGWVNRRQVAPRTDHKSPVRGLIWPPDPLSATAPIELARELSKLSAGCGFAHDRSKTKMQRFVHKENIALYRKLISESFAMTRDEVRHKMLVTLLADEIAKEKNSKS